MAIDQHGRLPESRRLADISLLSPELALVDPELAQSARAALGAPGRVPAAAGRAGAPGAFHLVSAPPLPSLAPVVDAPPSAAPAPTVEAALPTARAPLRRPVDREVPEPAPAPMLPVPEPAAPPQARRLPRPVRSAAVVLGLLAAVTALSSVPVSRPELLAPEPETRPPTQSQPKERRSAPAAASGTRRAVPRATRPARQGSSTPRVPKPASSTPRVTKPASGTPRQAKPAPGTPRQAKPAPSTPRPARRSPVTPPRPGIKQRAESRRLTWAPVAGVRKYEVRLYRGGKLIFHGTTTANAIEVPVTWRIGGQLVRLEPGRYEWYVWAYNAGGTTLRRPAVVRSTLTILPD